MIRMDTALAEAGLNHIRMLLQVHDELIFEAAEADAERAIPVIRQVMENAALPALSMKVPLAVDARAALNWERGALSLAPDDAGLRRKPLPCRRTSRASVPPSVGCGAPGAPRKNGLCPAMPNRY